MLGLKLEVLRPFLQHLYPGRFSGLQELVKRGYNIERRLERIEYYLAKLAGEDKPIQESVREPEDELLALTQSELEGYIAAVKEIIKLSPLLNKDSKMQFDFFEKEDTLTDERIEAYLKEARRLGLKTPVGCL